MDGVTLVAFKEKINLNKIKKKEYREKNKESKIVNI